MGITTNQDIVQRYVGTSYDVVRHVYEHIDELIHLDTAVDTLVGNLEDLVNAGQLVDVYLGAQAADPTLDNHGNPLDPGDFYFNTVTLDIRYYTGSEWIRPVDLAVAASTSATASAAAALASETNASTSETNAAGSATAAGTSATNASVSATNAANSATTATTEAANALAAVSSVGSLTSQASNSATYAAEWATNAEDVLISVAAGGDNSTDYSSLHHAAKAAASATAAATSETNAATSATNAGTSESNAATSASNAAASAASFTASYTVAGLPAATNGVQRAFVTDATTPTWGAAAVGGGAVFAPVYSDGSAWYFG